MMNSTLTLLAKDLRVLRGMLLGWAVAVAASLMEPSVKLRWPGLWERLENGFAWTALSGLAITWAIVLVAIIVQEDPPLRVSAFWKTRPIAPGRLFASKLLLGGILFLPIVLFYIRRSQGYLGIDDVVGGVGVLFCVMSVAAASRQLVEFVTMGIGAMMLWGGAGTIGLLVAVVLDREASDRGLISGMSRGEVSGLLMSLAALLFLIGQYWRPRNHRNLGFYLVTFFFAPLLGMI